MKAYFTRSLSVAAVALAMGGLPVLADDCTKIEAYGYADNIGTGKDQAKGAVKGRAEQWGAQKAHMTSIKYTEVECKKVTGGYKCEAEAKVCEVD